MTSHDEIQFYSIEYWDENYDDLMSRVEAGEILGIDAHNGKRAVMVPVENGPLSDMSSDEFTNL